MARQRLTTGLVRGWVLLLALAVLLPNLAAAQNLPPVPTRIDPPNPIVGQVFQYIIEADTAVSRVSPPSDFSDNIELVSQRFSQETRQSIVNGQVSFHMVIRTTFRAKAPGDFLINPTPVYLANGTRTNTEPIRGRVMEPPKMTLGSLGTVHSANTGQARYDRDLQGAYFTVTEVPETIHEGQAVPVRTWVYRSRPFQVADGGLAIKTVATAEYMLPVPEASAPVPELRFDDSVEVDGTRYERALLHTTVLVPSRPGKTTIKGADFDVHFIASNPGQPRFFAQTVPASLPPQEVEVEVLPLPPKPAGAVAQLVGDFQASASVDRSSIKEGDLLTVTVRLSGEGYLGTFGLTMPEIPGLTHVSQEVQQTIEPGGLATPVISTKTFQEIYQVNEPGRVTIPPLQFAVFDPKTGEQRVIQTAAATVTVEQSDSSALPLLAGGATRRPGEARALGGSGDILFIDTEPLRQGDLYRSHGSDVLEQPWFWSAHAVPIGLVLLASLAAVARRRRESDPSAVSRRQRRTQAQEALKEARTLKTGEGAARFYGVLARAVLLAVAARTGREPSGLTASDAASELRRSGLEDEATHKVEQLLERCQSMAYAPSNATLDREDDWKAAEALIARMEKRP